MYRQCNCNNSCNQDYENDYSNNDNMFNQSCNNMNMSYSSNNLNTNSCSCGFDGSGLFPDTLLYAHSYVPHQYMNNVYTPEYGLKMGSIFPELVSPYCPGQSQEILEYLKNSKDFEGGCE